MATKSILKDVKVDRSLGRSLATALKSSKEAPKSKNGYQQTPNRIDKENIKKFLGLERK